MLLCDIINHPVRVTLITWIIGIILSDDLDAREASVFGRLIIDIGEAFVTRAVILAAREAIEEEAANQASQDKDSQNDQLNTCLDDNTQNIISQLCQQNKYLQEQIWELQSSLAKLQSKLD
jgi:hypothetical protein